MSKPNVETKGQPASAPSQVGGAAETLAATAMFDPSAPPRDEASPEATVAFDPPRTPAGGDPTVEVTNLAFPRLGGETGLDATLAHIPTLPPIRRRHREGEPEATLDAEGKTNAFSISSADGSAEIVMNDLPFVVGYKLLSELGRGGMGVVYKARQMKLDRLVALKMVLAGAHASADQLARFLIEAQAVAHLTHNNIVQIFDVGERDGLPFFSLEYIDGGSLQQTIGGKPQPVRYAAKTVSTLCSAMAFAHSQGIIHRDLKPANVLMTNGGEPKITDFGLAKRLEGDSQQTRDGAIMGTPSYMAPEQAWGRTSEIGPLADQHALGAILYEMLTGRPPYQGANPLDTLDQVRNQEPVPPTRLQPKVPRDLETIALKALQKDPKKRYESCGYMAEDLNRYLDGQPILARPVSAPERAWRWCRRNPVVAALTGLAASLVLGVAGVSSYAAVVLNEKNADLEVAKGEETRAKVAAQENEQKAVQRENEARAVALAAVDQTQTMLEAQRFTAILANQLLRDIPNTIAVRREMFKVTLESMDRAQKDMDKLRAMGAGGLAVDAMTLRTLAAIHQQRGIIYADMGPRYADKVWPEFDQMKALTEKHFAIDPSDLEALKNLASGNLTLGEYTFKLKADTAAAEPFYRRAIELRRQWLETWPTDDVAKNAVANALGALAGMLQESGDPAKAEPLYEEEVGLREAVGVELSRSGEFQRELAGLNEKLGDLNMRLGHVAKARKFYDRSLAIRTEVAEANPEHNQAQRDLLLSLQKSGHDYLIQRDDPKRARDYYQKAADGFRDRLKADPQNGLAQGDLALAQYYAGAAALREGDLSASDKAFAESLALRRELAESPSAKTDGTRAADLGLMLGLARCNDHAEASKIAADLLKVPPSNPYLYFQVACGYALCASAAERVQPDDKALAKGYRDSAFQALRNALAQGWKSPEEVATDPDLAPLRSDERFGPLVDDIRKAASAG